MMDLKEYAKNKLLCDRYTCVICDGKNEILSRERGVSFLLSLYNNKADIKNYFVADKVVGKGAALLYVLLEIKDIYAHIISKSALDVLKSHGIECTYNVLVEHIINRAGDGICPIESATIDIDNPADAPSVITTTLEKLKNAK